MTDKTRAESFGQSHDLTWVDRFGVWLSARGIRRWAPDFQGKTVADVGCGFEARFSRTIAGQAEAIHLFDVALSRELGALPGVRLHQGPLPATLAELASGSVDVLLCISVLEHLKAPEEALGHFHRALRKGGLCLLNVPSWRGKFFLELSAFRLGLSPKGEMDDHKMYYDPRDLWPLLVRAGFLPSDMRVFRHKFGLNTFAVLRT